MRLRDISYALRVATEVARAGEQLISSFERSRSRLTPVLFGMGLGVGLGALLFSEPARQRVKGWLAGEAHEHHAGSAPH
jgi:hypothetical protein